VRLAAATYCRAIANEAHTLLQHAAIPGPYVRRHSMGGAPVRVFAQHPMRQTSRRGADRIDEPGRDRHTRARHDCHAPNAGAVSIITSSHESARFRRGLACSLVTDPVAAFPDDANAIPRTQVTVRSFQARSTRAGHAESLAQACRVTTLGSVPLIRPLARLPEDGEQKCNVSRPNCSSCSSDSQQVFADQSHTTVQFEQPAAAVGAICRWSRRFAKP